jgi:ABC-2 type transport system permease protein
VRYLRLLGTFLRLSMLNEMQYRANLVLQLFTSVLALGNGLAGLALVFYHTQSLGGWGPNELLVVVAVYTLIAGWIRAMIQPNMWRIMEGIQEGALDYTLTKPEDAQVLVSMTNFELWKLVDVLLGLGLLVYSVTRLGAQIGLGEALLFALMLVCGGLIIYSLWLAVTTTSFWVVRMWAIFEFFDRMYQAGRYPVGIYPSWLRLILTFIVPVAFAVTAPAEALTDRLTPQTLALALGLTVFALAGSRLFWKFGLRHYSGASA